MIGAIIEHGTYKSTSPSMQIVRSRMHCVVVECASDKFIVKYDAVALL